MLEGRLHLVKMSRGAVGKVFPTARVLCQALMAGGKAMTWTIGRVSAMATIVGICWRSQEHGCSTLLKRLPSSLLEMGRLSPRMLTIRLPEGGGCEVTICVRSTF